LRLFSGRKVVSKKARKQIPPSCQLPYVEQASQQYNVASHFGTQFCGQKVAPLFGPPHFLGGVFEKYGGRRPFFQSCGCFCGS